MNNSEDLPDWLRLEQTAGVGSETARRLLQEFGLPQNIFAANFSALQRVVSEKIARALLTPLSDKTALLIEKTQSWIQQPGNLLLNLADARYPRAVLNIPDPPLILYIKGQLELLSRPILAIVGSRHATTQGIQDAKGFARALSQAGLTIASGLALGIDTAAHQGSLEAQGSTIAVIGTGADIVYPARNRTLAHQIAKEGCIISEHPLGMPAIAANFPRRNRLISGLARGVLVIEAAAQSGSLITARMAAEQGREVFAIPGSIHSPLSKGCHQLIRQGAKLVESAQDVLEELHYNRPAAALSLPVTAFNPDEQTLLEVIGYSPVNLDVLTLRSGWDIAALNGQLLKLEMAGVIEVLPGGNYRRVH